jgi:hypothetical protein
MTKTTNNQQRTLFKTKPIKANFKGDDGFSAIQAGAAGRPGKEKNLPTAGFNE